MSEAIIKKMRSEEVLIESERFAYKVLNASLNGIYIHDVKLGQNVFINSQYTTITGYTFGDLTRLDGTQFFELFHPDDRQRVAEHLERVVNGRDDVVEVEYRFKTRDGRWIWCLSHDSEFAHNQDGSVSQIIGTFIDITERKQAEEELRQSRKDLDRAQEVGQIGSWRLDVSDNILTWSDENHRIFGVPKGTNLTYESFLEIVHPDDREFVDTQWKAGLRGEPYDIEHRIIVAGEIRWVREKAYLEFNEEGVLLGGFGITQDITERKNFEDELRQSSHFPEENPNPVLRCTHDGVLLYANASARDWLATFGWQVPGALPQLVRVAVAEARGHHRTIETEITDTAGRTFTIFAVQPPGADYINLYSIDLTDRKKAEEALKNSNKELEQFAYVASHDLQEPLRAIVGFLQLLQSRCGDQIDEKGQHYIERSVKAGHRMQTLIRELLTLSRVNTKGATFVATDFNGLVNDVLDNLQSIIQEKNANITCAKLPNLTVDGAQIQSLFQNLILNAVRYNESLKPCIEVSCRERDHVCHFFVKDNGIGISPQFHQRIFMVFQRLHTDREYPGTGLGLALCKKIVERHGGRIWVESQPQEGSTFHFTLPRSK